MKTIFTKKGQPIYVDDSDYDWAMQWCWRLSPDGYAMRNSKFVRGQKRKTIFMHRAILELADPKVHADHINGEKSDNRRSNLRIATHTENMRNRRTHKNNACGLKGVSWRKDRNKWSSQIMCNGVSRHLGYHNTPEAAYAAYCSAAIEMHGEFANTGAQRD